MVAFERTVQVIGNKANPPYVTLLTLRAAGFSAAASVDLKDGQTTELNLDGVKINNDVTIARVVAQSATSNHDLIGKNCFENAQIDEVVCLCEQIERGFILAADILPSLTFCAEGTLFPARITLADIAIWSVIAKDDKLQKKHSLLFEKILADPVFTEAHSMAGKFTVAAAVNPKTDNKEKQKDEGKFVDLPGAEKGKVVVRFPPEASGYLHIGHAKAALLNQYYQQTFDGTLIMRFDDTNPAKENAHFEQVIIEDLKMLNVVPDRWTHSSDYFELMLEMCEKLIKEGKAFVDDTDTETMRKEREDRVDSRHRTSTPAANLALWEEMKKGSARGTQCCVRIKIDMKSNNGAMRDPTIYRCKPEEHVRTGTKYKVYPTYDFTCPIVDSVEGVTHTLRTTEYHDRDDQYYFICDALGIRKPYIWEYARLNMTNTVMSKRKLTWFVEEKHVEGWDDPRLPTVRGVMRHGMTVEGLKQFIIAQGGSRSVVVMEWDKIWSFNKKVIDPVAPRYTALDRTSLVPVTIAAALTMELAEVALHPKNTDVGNKSIWKGSTLLLEQVDARALKEGDVVTFVNWGNMKVSSIKKDGQNVIGVEVTLDLENKDYKKTLKVTWLGDAGPKSFISVVTADYDHIITKPIVGKDEDWKQYINYESCHYTQMLGESALSTLKKGDIIQLQRKGYYIVDHQYQQKSPVSGCETPLLLISIPDGHVKESKNVASTVVDANANGVAPSVGNDSASLYAAVEEQGNTVRVLKGKDPKSDETQKAVKRLLDLKKTFKEVTGQEFKPGQAPSPSVAVAPAGNEKADFYKKVEDQGTIVRDQKAKDAKSDATKAAIAQLLDLKKQYKEKFGEEWKPGQPPVGAVLSVQPSFVDAKSTFYKSVEAQGLLVRDLKAKDAKSDATKAAIAKLLEVKKEYKEKFGEEWKPGMVPASPAEKVGVPVVVSHGGDKATLYKAVEDQGLLVRDLKAKDSKSGATKAAITQLLALKLQYKEKFGEEFKPGMAPVVASTPVLAAPSAAVNDKAVLYKAVEDQGLLVRDLKAKDPKSDAAKGAIVQLLAIKLQYKEKFGEEWKPGNAPAVSAATSSVEPSGNSLYAEVEAQGLVVRDEKAKYPKSDSSKAAIAKLLELKKKYKEHTGQEYKQGAPPTAAVQQKKDEKPKTEPHSGKKDKKKDEKPKKEVIPAADGKKQTKLGIDVAKYDNYSEWYSQVITKGEMIEYYDVSGCYVLRPWSYSIWEQIKKWFDIRIKRMGVKNCYFPMFVSQAALEREKDHIADFAPEVAWVTRAGSSEMAEPIAIRPTSETVMYPSYKKWVQSHRDLPLKLNQWCNVVRWEFKHPTPFLRTREFLWQEGHTAYANTKDAQVEVFKILDLYEGVYQDLLAVPVIKGRKSEKEKFAGGDFTTTVEAYVPVNGRGVQGATSHHLGQNFSKMFDISYEAADGTGKTFAWQNSWGLTTRTIGAMVMIHGDDNGLVMPPRVAAIQVVILAVGLTAALSAEDKQKVTDAAIGVADILVQAGIRAEADLRENYSPGWKFNHWELKGVPIRIEVGPKDLASGQVTVVVRHDGKKLAIVRDEIATEVPKLLEEIHHQMFNKVLAERDSHMKVVFDFQEFRQLLDEKFIILSPFCGAPACEEAVKRDSVRDDDADGAQMGAKTLCIPLEQPKEDLGSKCIHPDCSSAPTAFALFGRSY